MREFHHRYSADPRQAIIDLIARGIHAREIRSTTDPGLVTTMLLGAVFYRRLMTSKPFNSEDAEQLVTLVLA